MLAIYATIALAAVSSVSGAPVYKRIQQTIADSTAQWEQACLAAGGGQQCNPVSIRAFSTLLAAPGPCEQQDAADAMIDLAHQLNNDSEMIRLTKLFRQQPRNAPDSLSVLYCQNAPRNSELSGLFQCQFQGVNDNIFGSFANQVAVGTPGTIPFGQSSILSPPGSCPANPGGKIPDGTQLNTIVSDPGNGGSSGNNNGNNDNNNATPPPAATTPTEDPAPADDTPATTPASDPAPVVQAPSSSGSFQDSNASAAQTLNIGFKSITAGSSCNEGDIACAGDQFAQCVGGAFVTTACAGGTQCMALPLVNKVGTSVTCTTLDDAARRFSGISGGFDGSH